MHVLVSAATRHGATGEIAEVIRGTLTREGLEVTVLAPAEVRSLDAWDAAIIGSGVYMGRWLEPARDLVERQREALATKPTWVFSSGPVGDPPKPAEEPADAIAVAASIGARDHRVFAGRLARRELGFGEKAIISALRAPEGDFRPWREIESWAMEIAAQLKQQA